MKKEIAEKLRLEYAHLWDDSMADVPDGWITPLTTMLDKLYALSDVGRSMSHDAGGLATWVKIRVEVSSIIAIAYAAPLLPAGKWNPSRALACIEVLSGFQRQTQETCELCGLPGTLNDGHVRCVGHAGADPAAARADALYQEVRDLFPEAHGKAIDLAVPDYLFELVTSTLRSILKLVKQEDIVGKVMITRIEMDDGALFVRVRCNDLTAVHLGTQMSVNEMIADLEALSDEATRQHQLKEAPMPLPKGSDRDEFINRLREKHSRILPPTVDFAIEDGWLPLISDSLDKIEKALDRHGWIGKCEVRQIKEKLGDLRIYVRPRRASASFPKSLLEELATIRHGYTSASVETCEICGGDGEIGNFAGYYQTLCPRHSEQRRQWIARGREGELFHD